MKYQKKVLQQKQSSDVILHMNELQTILQIDLSKQAQKKPHRIIKKYPLNDNLKKVTRLGNEYYYAQYRIGIVEIELVEQEDFAEKQQIVKEIRQLIYNFKKTIYISNAPWSIAEFMIILIVLYDHDIRDDKMQKSMITSTEFFHQIKKNFDLCRNFEAYKKKIGEVKAMNFSMKDIQSILTYIKDKITLDPRNLDEFKIRQTPQGVVFECKNQGLIKWNRFQSEDESIQLEQQEKFIKTKATEHLVLQRNDSSKECKMIYDEKFLSEISLATGIHMTELRLLWQTCCLDIVTLIDKIQESLKSAEEETDQVEKDLV